MEGLLGTPIVRVRGRIVRPGFTNGTGGMDTILQELRDTVRGALRRPGFAVAVVVSLGLGLGAAGAVLALVDAILVRPLPYPGVDRVVGAWFASPNFPGGLDRVRQSPGTYVHIRDNNRAFESMGLADAGVVTVDDGTEVRRDPAAFVTGDLFQVLNVSTALGRPLTVEDSEPGAEPVIVISDGFWERQFGRSADVIGRLIGIDGVQRRVVGVLPAAVRFPEGNTELWVPLVIDPAKLEQSDLVNTGYLRLRPGVTLEAATEDFNRLINLLPESYPNTFPRPLLERLQLSPLFVPLRDELVGDVRQPLLLVLLAVAVLLGIVAANVTGLFVVRNEGRIRDIAVRAAAGAPMSRIQTALITEGLAYGAVGAALGVGVASGGLLLLRRLGSDVIPRLHEVTLAGRPALAMVVLALALGLTVAGIAMLRVRSLDLGAALRSGGRTVGDGRRVSRIRRGLVSLQVALALVLLVDAGLLVRTLGALQSVPTGFASEDRLGVRVFLSERDYPDFDAVRRFHESMVDALAELPGVQSVAAASFLPLRDGRIFLPFQVEGSEATDELPSPRLLKVVSGDFFGTMNIPVLYGRGLLREDADGDQDVVVVSQAFAALYFPEGGAVGQRIRAGRQGDWLEIVGVVGDIRDRDLTAPAPPIVYAPLEEQHVTSRWREMSYVLKASDPQRLAGSVQSLIRQRDRGVPVYDVRTMEQVLSDVTGRSRYTMLLVLAAALTALFLAGVGTYGVLAQMVGERKRELALRMALGADRGQVRAVVFRQTASLMGAGMVLGVALSLASTRAVGGLLFNVPDADPTTFVTVLGVLALVAWVAAAGPARRAARVSPAATLKELG